MPERESEKPLPPPVLLLISPANRQAFFPRAVGTDGHPKDDFLLPGTEKRQNRPKHFSVFPMDRNSPVYSMEFLYPLSA